MNGDPSQTFREEAADLLAELETTLLSLEQTPDDRDLLDAAFRALHTIKGSGAMFGFDAAAGFTHHLESAFELLRTGRLAPNPALIGVALAARDHIRALIEAPESADPQMGEDLLARVADLVGRAATGGHEAEDVADVAAPESERRLVRIRFRLSPDSLTRGVNPLLLLDELRGLGSCTVVALTESVPMLEDLDPTLCHLAWDLVLTTDQPRSAIEDVFIFVIDDMDLQIEEGPPEGDRIGQILVGRGDLQPAMVEAAVASQKRLGAILVERGVVGEDRLRSALAEQNHARVEAADAARGAQASGSTSIRVPADRLDSLMDQVGELVIAQARLKQVIAGGVGDSQIKSIAEEIERLAASLRDTTMVIRMVPIGSLFGRFRRLVHDLSQSLGKDVRLTMSGEETELDKTVIERLNDPMVHVIRNSMDHGMETVEERTRAGKPAQGNIHLAARHSGAQVLITVSDDGRGIDRERVRAKAEDQGLIPAGAKLSDAELLQMIFHPGFSTAQIVTSVSGRGVGMDVVKRTIDALRGSVEVASRPGEGAEITLKLPLTLAIIDGLLVRVGLGRYVIPLSAVEECVELPDEDKSRHSGRSFLNIRGALVPFLRLRDMFHSTAAPDPYQKVVIVSAGERRVGLVLDQVLGEHQTVIKSLSKLHMDVESFSGATILGDGAVALILDIPRLVARGQALDQSRRDALSRAS